MLLAAAVAVVAIAVVVVAPGDPAPTTIRDRAAAVASGLRCPVCANLSVADSPSALAGEMRREIERRLRAGQTDEEVRAYFVDRYGRWVLLVPEGSGLNLLPLLFPLAALAVGGVSWWALVRRRRPTTTSEPSTRLTEADRARLDRELEGNRR